MTIDPTQVPEDQQSAGDIDPDIDTFVEPENPLPSVELSDLPDDIQETIKKAGWASLVPVQQKAIPYLLSTDRDLMVQSRTGSGKTGAFVIPALIRITPEIKACQILILVPTRELAQQVSREAERLCASAGVQVATVIGGVAYGPQVEAFRQGAQIVVGTPGRILDHLREGNLYLDDLEMLIFDEADKMLSMGFYPDMVQMKRFMPDDRSAYMFSATYTASVMTLAREFLHKPGFLSLSRERVHVDQIQHVSYEVSTLEKDNLLVRLIELEAPANAIIFCNTKDRVNYVAHILQRHGYSADQISADLNQKQRERVLTRLRDGELRFLVATDLAGRGIDIPDLSHVFLYEFPDDPENYIHRAGRTGRAGSDGVCISLVALRELAEMERTARKFNINFERRECPTEDDVDAAVTERVITALELRQRLNDHVEQKKRDRFLPLAQALAESPDLHHYIAMLLDDYYQQAIHGNPPPLPSHKFGQSIIERATGSGAAPKSGDSGRPREGRGRDGDGKGSRGRRSGGSSGRSGRSGSDVFERPAERGPKPAAPQEAATEGGGEDRPRKRRRRSRSGRGGSGEGKPEGTTNGGSSPVTE